MEGENFPRQLIISGVSYPCPLDMSEGLPSAWGRNEPPSLSAVAGLGRESV